MKPRHWEEIEAILDTEFTPEEPLTLGHLVEIDAFELAEQLEEVSGKASSEAGLESILKKVCKKIWTTTVFNTVLLCKMPVNGAGLARNGFE